MRIAYVVGQCLGELVQGKAVAFYAREQGDENIFIAKEPHLLSAIEGDGFEAIPTHNTAETLATIKRLEPDFVFMCNSKSVIVGDPIFDAPPLPPKPTVCSLDSNWLFSLDERSYFTSPTWIDRIYFVMSPEIYHMGLEENGGHYRIPEVFQEKILPVGFIPSGKILNAGMKEKARKSLNLAPDEKLIFIYFGFLENLFAPTFFPLLKRAVEELNQNGSRIRVLFKGKYEFPAQWLIRESWFDTEAEFNAYLLSADLIIQHHGLGTLPKAVHNQVPAISLVPHIEDDLPHYEHSEYYEIEPFHRLNLCEILPVEISTDVTSRCMHFFEAIPDRYPVHDISMSGQKLQDLLEGLLYDEDTMERMKEAQQVHFQAGEEYVYQDLVAMLES